MMQQNSIDTEVKFDNGRQEEKEFVNPAFPKEIYDRAITAKEALHGFFVQRDMPKNQDAEEELMQTVNDLAPDILIAASCGEFTFNHGHGWEFKMPSTRDIMAKLQKADEDSGLRYTLRFSKIVSHHKDQFGTTTEKVVRYIYVRKFNKEEE